MTCLPPHINNVPARILLRITAYLDDDTLLAFLTACCRILGSVSSDEIDWKKLFCRDFTITNETHYWQSWHDNVLKKETTTVKHECPDIRSNYRRLRRYMARLNVTNNWRKKAITSDTLYITDNLPDGVTNKLNTRIIANNVYGTLILTDVYTLYLVEHDPKPKLLFIANVLTYFSADSYARITGDLNNWYIVLSGPKRVGSNEASSDAVVYWQRNQLATMKAKLLPDTKGGTQIVDMVGRWLLLKKPTTSSETYPISVFNLTSPKPLRIESASNWNTYVIRCADAEKCRIYAAHFGFSNKDNKLFYNWSKLKATSNDISYIHKDINVTLPSLARKYGACHSRLLLYGKMILVWQYASASNELVLSKNDNNHAANGSSSAQLSNTNQQTKEDIQNLFFIHCASDDSICYEGTFTEHLPEIATNPNRIIILNGSNLKILSLESKSIIVDTMIAPDLTYVGFALSRFWVTQHPDGGFYVRDIHNPDKTYHIPCDDVASKTVAINPHMLMKVIDNKVILWNINQTV
ncbi:hypothetical protein BDF22DRAFT_684328 [Syncephalis plumigaleata]|nr:hypothetical protein BDF22DRAFT_684328 [Syncephalis plumigaleata]